MTNEFKDVDSYVFAEELNGMISVISAFQPIITHYFPADYEGGLFDVGDNEVGMMKVNLILDNCEIASNKIQLITGQTTGTATFRIYPNIAPFKKWKSIGWSKTGTTGTVTCT